jgi:hypothetical protein
MKDWQRKPSLWATDRSSSDTELTDDLVRHVVVRTRHRVLIKDMLYLFIKGFGSIIAGLLGGRASAPPAAERGRGKRHDLLG